MLTLALVVLALARPPTAYVDTGTKHVPLTISSWCWESRCGAPIARARRVIVVRRGSTVRVHLGFAPTALSLAVGGVRITTSTTGDVVAWKATQAGGLSLTATGVRGFVTYVGRIAFSP